MNLGSDKKKDMYIKDYVYPQIKQQINSISTKLMETEKKDFCLCKISEINWLHIKHIVDGKPRDYIIVPSVSFKNLILNRGYLRMVSEKPESFGTGNAWDIIRTLKQNNNLIDKNISDMDFLSYISGETMAYVFKINANNEISDKILRMDLCRDVRGNAFVGGLFHLFKHFTIEDYETISNEKKQFVLKKWDDLYSLIIDNFFSDDFERSKGNVYIGYSRLKDGHFLKGAYYKEESSNVYFINTVHILSDRTK